MNDRKPPQVQVKVRLLSGWNAAIVENLPVPASNGALSMCSESYLVRVLNAWWCRHLSVFTPCRRCIMYVDGAVNQTS